MYAWRKSVLFEPLGMKYDNSPPINSGWDNLRKYLKYLKKKKGKL